MELVAVEAYLSQHNADARPFIWTAPAADTCAILKKVGLQNLPSNCKAFLA